MTDFRLSGRPGQAIFYGKLSVAVWERIRVSARNLGPESGKSFIEAQANIYGELTDLLISQGRISEGTEILGLLKEEEYSQYIPRGAPESAQPPPPVLTGEETDREHRYKEGADRVAAAAARGTELRAKSSLTPAETQELKQLDAESEQAMAAFQKTLSELEQESNVEFTLASRTRLEQTPSADWKVLGAGVSKAKPGFAALPSVPLELHNIVRTGNDSSVSGVLPGKVLLDGDFTEAQLKDSLRASYSVVHIASHFDLEPENSDKSFLLLGDGTHLTLTQLSLIPNLFANVDLLTLSACNTAVGLNIASGNEWESLGMIAQRKGAKAIIATLWPGADESTTFLMQQFYRLHTTHPGISKAEALRKAQLTLLEESGDPARARFAHPFFWAPFVLIGNWK